MLAVFFPEAEDEFIICYLASLQHLLLTIRQMLNVIRRLLFPFFAYSDDIHNQTYLLPAYIFANLRSFQASIAPATPQDNLNSYLNLYRRFQFAGPPHLLEPISIHDIGVYQSEVNLIATIFSAKVFIPLCTRPP